VLPPRVAEPIGAAHAIGVGPADVPAGATAATALTSVAEPGV